MITRRRGAVGDNVPSDFIGGSPHERVPKRAARSGDGCPVECSQISCLRSHFRRLCRSWITTGGQRARQRVTAAPSFLTIRPPSNTEALPCQRTELDLQVVKVTGVERCSLECCQQSAHDRCLEHKHLKNVGELDCGKTDRREQRRHPQRGNVHDIPLWLCLQSCEALQDTLPASFCVLTPAMLRCKPLGSPSWSCGPQPAVEQSLSLDGVDVRGFPGLLEDCLSARD